MPPRRRTVTLLVVLCLGHVLLISSQVQSETGSSVLNSAALGSVARVQGGLGGVAGGVGGLWSHYIALGNAARENEALRGRILDLEGELQGERARATRLGGLEDALNLQRSIVAPTLAARVIAGNPMTGMFTINVDRGADDGVVANMAVINGRGVVGRVIGRPSAHAATVQLLIDRSANAGALLEKAGVAGSVSGGYADGNLRLDLISSVTPIALGERVVTSGHEGIYPQGLLIGEVRAINGTGKAREVVVAPVVNFARVDVVLIMLTRPAPAGGQRP